MRLAIVSDVHGNLEALQAVLAEAAVLADGVACLGDVVGYGADPGPCLALVAAKAATVVAGNHEYAVVDRLPLRWFNPVARAAAVWTRAQLSEDERGWLAGLSLRGEVAGATLVHASPHRPETWPYLVAPEDAADAFAAFTTALCFVGHSHRAAVWSLGADGPPFASGLDRVTLVPGARYLINVGSVGQPRDGDPRAAYAIWDPVGRAVTFRRVPYDVAGARRKILAAGLPRVLAERLGVGA